MQDVGVQEHGREQGLQMHPMHNFRRFHRIPRYETVPQAELSEDDKDVRHDKRDEGDQKPAERARLAPFRDSQRRTSAGHNSTSRTAAASSSHSIWRRGTGSEALPPGE